MKFYICKTVDRCIIPIYFTFVNIKIGGPKRGLLETGDERIDGEKISKPASPPARISTG